MVDERSLAAVIVTFNRLEKLKRTIEHTLINRFDLVVVVNNASTDGTAEWLESLEDERLIVLHSEKNLGGAGGFSQGFNHVATELPEIQWLVCFDDDAWPELGAVTQFQELEIPSDVGSVAVAVYLPDGEQISEMNRPSVNPFWHLKKFVGTTLNGRKGFHVGDSDYHGNEVVEVDSSSFVGCFIRVENIRNGAIGLPRSELFIYADDIIYVLESRKAGFRHFFAPSIRFRHDCETLVNQQDVYRPLWKVYYTYRNRLELFRIASGFFYPFVLLIKVPSFFLKFRFYEKSEQRMFFSITARAVWDGIRRDFRKKHHEVLAFSKLKE
ncbi:glycosyltransferase [Candidatus Seongchinamella marina]|uniref:glycosyltransferase n=1 Tax=Candidatus Seongchinamella marina TaxID=2518990 RepID=UPI0024300361|nr:glycosyltransferase [Candidatus Seongchinamella marina]